MPGKVTLQPGGQEFVVTGRDSILEAALSRGLPLSYGCSNGNCGECRAHVVSGSVECVRHHDYLLTEAERAGGWTLLCSYTPQGDVTVEAAPARGAGDIPLQHLVTKVRQIQPLDKDISLLHLQTPRTERLRFLAGQSVRLTLADGATGEYPVASCPCDDRNLHFHVRARPEDAFSTLVAAGLANGEAVTVDGPAGSFTLDPDSSRPLLFIACDTGFAPIKSLIEHAVSLERGLPITLYWLACDEGGHYLHNLVRSWTDAFEGFRYVPLTPELESEESTLMSRLQREYADFGATDIYIAGPDPMPDAVQRRLVERGARTERVKTLVTH
jgi:CDP-4-dehydro-6-deoxyglucose reductase